MAKNTACETCKELNEEAIDSVSISEIYILGAGFYHYNRTISYCPTCGKRIKGKKRYNNGI